MSQDSDTVALIYFRATPADLDNRPPLASSLQSLETAIFLIALGRFPSALVMCATAWESALKAKLGKKQSDKATLQDMLDEVRLLGGSHLTFDSAKLDAFRKTRNRLVHYGFSPRDDEVCARLLLDTGLPFLSKCYQQLFDLFLDWRDVRPGVMGFRELNDAELKRVGLIPDVADQLYCALETYRRARDQDETNPCECFRAMAHYVRLGMKAHAMTSVESKILQHAEEAGGKWQHTDAFRSEIVRVFGGATWEFDCPVCDGFQSMIVELDEERLEATEVAPIRGICIECGFSAGHAAGSLLEVLLAPDILQMRESILKDFGLNK